MKFVALAFGLLATAFAFTVDYYFGAISRPILAFWPGSGGQVLGLGLLLLISGSGLVGGLLALISPLSGGLLLLGAACGWFALGASTPDGFSAAIVVPLALCLLASIAGIIAAGHPPRVPADTERLPTLEDIRREEALTRDLERRFEELPTVSVPPAAPPELPDPEPPAEDAADSPRRKRPPLLLVLVIANFVLLSGLTLAVLLLYLELKGGSLGR